MTQEDFDTATGAEDDGLPDDWTPAFYHYETSVMRTAGGQPARDVYLACALGLAGEAGEYADLIKKYLFHGHILDHEKALEELGDVLWYIARVALQHGSSLTEVAEMNVRKLRARYPNGFSTEDSIARRDVR